MNQKGDNTYQILRRTIPNIKLYSLTSPYWYDSYGNLVPWSDSQTLPPPDGEIIYNVSTNVPVGYYIWTGTTISTPPGAQITIQLFSWELITKAEAYGDYHLPIFLESKVDEMGVMVGFSGKLEQI